MVKIFDDITKELEIVSNQIHDSLFEPYDDFSEGEAFGKSSTLRVEDIEKVESIAYQLQDEIKSLETNIRYKHWMDMLDSLTNKIIDLVSYDGYIYTLSKFNSDDYQSDVIDGKIFDNDRLDDYLQYADEEAHTKLESLLEDSKENIFELEEKIKQLIALLKAVV